ncbi:Zn2Cys6 transcription factor [Aspergillus flavus]|nr:Zn2Cys6 transcription factor [Aspergillus flavus]
MRLDMSEMEATSTQSLVEGPNSGLPRKRPRPVISCLRCREKKLKCDRVTPCENCTKAGCPADCVYNQGLNLNDNVKRVRLSSATIDQQSAPRGESGGGAGIGIIEDLQQRVIRLEERLVLGSRVVNPDLAEDVSVPQISSDLRPYEVVSESDTPRPFLGTLVVKGTRTRYHGQNNRITLLNQFPKAKEFIAQCNENSTIVDLAREVRFLQGKLPGHLDSPASTVDGRSSPELVQLRASLPAKTICDLLLRTYTNNFEKIFRIIHVPSFLREYAQFWAEPDQDFYQSSSAFIPQLTAICTISLALDGQRTKVNDSALWEYLSGPAITLIQLWLQNLTRKQRTELATLQAETLLLLSRRLRLVPAEELWKATGALIRSAMVTGLHLNLAKCTELSVFQTQVRRRLWITIVEMDLEASIASGMPVMTSPHDVGPPPANLDDSDFDESTPQLPSEKGPSDLTDSLYQISLATSLADRLRAMSVVRIAREQIDLSELAQQGSRIVEHLQQIPRVLKPGNASTNNNDPAMLLNCVLLSVYTRRPLLCLYRPLVLGDPRDDPIFPEICRICLESSLANLSYQDNFNPSVADLEVCNLGAYWDLFQTFCYNDILWDALSVCGYIRLSSQRNIFESQKSGRALGSSMHSKASLIRSVESTLDSLTARIGEAGSNLKDILLLAVVLQSVRARGSTQVQGERMSQGASKALSACRQHLLPAVAEDSLALSLTDFAQMLQTTQPMFTSDGQGSFTSSAQLNLPEDFLAQSSALAMEFSNFQGDPFIFENNSFTWDV